MTNGPQILVYFINQPGRIVGGDPLCLRIWDQERHERAIVGMARLFEAGMVHFPDSDAMIVVGL